jgi:hypothetical protein
MHSPLGQRTTQTPHGPRGATGGSSGSAADSKHRGTTCRQHCSMSYSQPGALGVCGSEACRLITGVPYVTTVVGLRSEIAKPDSKHASICSRGYAVLTGLGSRRQQLHRGHNSCMPNTLSSTVLAHAACKGCHRLITVMSGQSQQDVS